ncbi:MAG: transglutaminase family protein [Pseudoclavibacter sp.]|nr:transglutaminase family protein [Pseudoclavibacter sp.]
MQRRLRSELELRIARPAELVLSIAVHDRDACAQERLEVLEEERPLRPRELRDPLGARLHALSAGPGRVRIRYEATVEGRTEPDPADEAQLVTFLRPSRYCESDALAATAGDLFGGLRGFELLDAVEDWVASRLVYDPASSLPSDGARDTLLKRRGVCRDYAHLLVALLRARDVPARFVSVYAPGLEPMDFHAVVEAHVEGRWWLVDATRMAPRSGMVRIAGGRDASDTAFLSNSLSGVRLERLAVDAGCDEPLAVEEPGERVQLG